MEKKNQINQSITELLCLVIWKVCRQKPPVQTDRVRIKGYMHVPCNSSSLLNTLLTAISMAALFEAF